MALLLCTKMQRHMYCISVDAAAVCSVFTEFDILYL